MPFVAGNAARLAIGKFAASCYVKEASAAFTLAGLDVTTWCKDTVCRISGLGDGSVHAAGYWDSGTAATDPDALIRAMLAATPSVPWSYGYNGFGVGQPVTAGAGRPITYNVGAAIDGVTEFVFDVEGDDLIDLCGYSLHDLAAETATGTGTVFDGSASSANGGAGYLHVSAFSGLTSIAVKIQHATTAGGSYSDLVTFTTATGTTSEQIVVATGTTVNRYLRCSFTVVGTGSATFTTSFARR